MMPPVKCFSCNRSDIGYLYKNYLGLLRKGYDESDALDALQITTDCCRVQFLTTNDLSDQIIASGRPVTIDYKMKEEEGKKETPKKIGDLGQMVVQDVQKYPSRVGPGAQEGTSQTALAEKEREGLALAEGEAVFTAYEGVEFLTEPEEVPVLESEGFSINRKTRGLFGEALALRQGAPVEGAISDGPFDLNSTFWGQINWIVGYGPQKEVKNKYYDEFMAMNGPLKLSFKLVEGVFVETVYAEEEGLQSTTPHQLVEAIDEEVLASEEEPLTAALGRLRRDFEGGSPLPSTILVLFAVKALRIMENPISIESIRRFFAVDFSNQTLAFVSFDYREEGSYRLSMRQDLSFNDREKLAQSVTTGKVIKKVEVTGESDDPHVTLTLNDGATFTFRLSGEHRPDKRDPGRAFYVSENDQIMKEGYENRLMERRIEMVMYPRSAGNKKLEFNTRFPVIVFDDLSFLVLTSRLRTASFGM